MSDLLKKTELFAHLLICPERPEQIAHIGSFVMSDLSYLLTVAHLSWATWVNRLHLSWAIWANEWMSEWAMSEWVNSQPGNNLWLEYICMYWFMLFFSSFLASMLQEVHICTSHRDNLLYKCSSNQNYNYSISLLK